MTKTIQKITLSPCDIPFNKRVLSQPKVRRVKAGVSIEQLKSIAQPTLLQSLNVRTVIDVDRNETGMLEVPASGLRYRTLDLLVEQKHMAKTQTVPCVVREGSIAKDDPLAENDERVGLHPLDQFRSFQALSCPGIAEEDIAAWHFGGPTVAKQRLRLACVSPKLLEVYAEDGMSLENLMAFSVTADPAKQEQVWDSVSGSGYDESHQIRRVLTENTVWASDRHVRFIGFDACKQAGGGILRNEHVFPFDQGTAILLPEGILFATYATPRTDERGERLSRVRQIIAWLVPHFARVSALDESHAMQKAEGLKGDRGELKAWAESIVVTERRTIYAHSACGTETRWLTVTIRDRLRSLGVFAELISCRLRMLVPVDTRGDEVLARLLARFPLTGVSDREAA